MLTIEEIQIKLENYSDEVKLFFHAYGLGKLILNLPVDHVAVKALNSVEYENYCAAILPFCKRLSSEPVGLRSISTAELYESLSCGEFGKTKILEIIEPKPKAAITTHDMIDHIELLADDILSIKNQLEDKDVECKIQVNDNHTALVVEINEWGQEVKFSDQKLYDLAERQILAGIAKVFQAPVLQIE